MAGFQGVATSGRISGCSHQLWQIPLDQGLIVERVIGGGGGKVARRDGWHVELHRLVYKIKEN